MNRRQKIIVSVVGIFIVLLALVGITYGYFLTRIQGNTNTTSITVTTADLKLVYGDGNNIVTATNIEPGESIDAKTFTVENEGNATVENYKVYLESVKNQLELKEDLTYTLTCEEYNGEEYEINPNTATKIRDCNGESNEVFPSVMSIIATNTIEVGNIHVYSLKLVYEETGTDQSVDMNKLVEAKVNIYDSKTKFLSTEIMTNVLAGTNVTTYIDPSLQDGESYTIPAEEISGENEKIISYTMDDEGTSYYYRGNVTDNYVDFAGMCWRIVRINGDGSVKLVLEDQDNTCEYSNGNWDIPASDGESLTIDSSTNEPYRTGNFGYDNITYSGKNIASYLNPITEPNRSMVNAYKYFQNNSLNEYLSKIKSGNWCYNDTAYDDSVGTNIINKENIYKSFETIYYDSYVRLSGREEKEPTLKCNGTILDYFNDNVTNMYVGTLTADEIVFAGGTISTNNSNYYLLNEFQKLGGLRFWTLTPNRFTGINDRILFVSADGGLGHSLVENPTYLFRPSVNLISGIQITGNGNGTKDLPYVIS